ncbi:MAG: prolipoprotein diacylglyceryl transferase [Planctomycetota bacterium]|nr:prolipoprotein diacylglyceryl transferase [Planctomycetota bacterium]
MRQTLFHIPHEFWGWPMFGPGWLLLCWAVAALGLLVWQARRQGWNADTLGYLPVLAMIGAAIYFLLPHLEEQPEIGPPLGLPIRGYGVMVLLGVIAGLALGMRTARRMGLDPEVIFGLSFAIFVGGIVGARAFYVIQYWPQFQADLLTDTVVAVLNVTQGGLVVYGPFFGGAATGYWYLRRYGLPVLAMADILAPTMMIGLALGRLGCLMNGCCYGGLCDYGLAFPEESPPYKHQRALGQLHGFRLGAEAITGAAVVQSVKSDGPALAAGLETGAVVRAINGQPLPSFQEACGYLEKARPDLTLETDRGRVRIVLGQYPPRSLRVHPTQIYAAMDAALLCFVLWAFYPFRRWDGEVFAWMLTLYPMARIVEELLRSDEPGRFGTRLSISQWVSVLLLAATAVFWAWLVRQPRGSVLPPPGDATPPTG